MSRRAAAACLLALLAAASAARANDSAAETAAGGLVLAQSRDIDMVSEDLFVSTREIRIRYVFRNRSPRPVSTIVAFPMPDRDPAAHDGEDFGWPSGFATRVDGRPVRMEIERRAFARGVDRTALLSGLGIPLRLDEDGLPAATRAIERLAPAQQQRLASLGLVDRSEPRWTVRETWHWRQTFPAGRDLVVEHRYAPGLGGTVATPLASHDYRAGDYGRAQIARYCIDADFIAAVERIARRQQAGDMPSISETWLSYILVTGGNWRAPIGAFRLVVEKDGADDLVSFCGSGLRRIGPTRFELRRTNWRPDRNLDVLFLHPQR